MITIVIVVVGQFRQGRQQRNVVVVVVVVMVLRLVVAVRRRRGDGRGIPTIQRTTWRSGRSWRRSRRGTRRRDCMGHGRRMDRFFFFFFVVFLNDGGISKSFVFVVFFFFVVLVSWWWWWFWVSPHDIGSDAFRNGGSGWTRLHFVVVGVVENVVVGGEGLG